MRRNLLLGLPFLAVAAGDPAGCTSDQITQAIVLGGCPPLVAYSKEFQHDLAAKMREMSDRDPRTIAIADYKGLRDACRAGGA
jgi:hypothetical protein